ncbi:hypothetical protein [Mucilaginibacter myungsuensis]|uniref:Uncharacterized protein n=1 Tax=Mucilaginibacter myungsuensis TaxID=649104 RepID=A0A929L0A4_9SPHI|nr:hypothetical protein [Mucilaginibacter myungsuensis]MBE9661800.1 hypothetical protein [Mucilaginibacter myungsuensis]MDN3599766.1 hypothetical protein [Mucilaginibacter myungsuensis]
MKRYTFTIIFFICALTASAQQGWTERSRLLPDQLRNIATGILVYHSPSPVYPEPNLDATTPYGKYVWKHSTYAMAQTEDLEVVAAGSYIWIKDKGWMPNMKLSKDEFADEFDCKDAMLKKGRIFTFKKNYRFGDAIYGGDALWFVIAKDKQGKLYKGYGLVETEGELRSK